MKNKKISMIVAIATAMTTMLLVTPTVTSFATTVNKNGVKVERASSQKVNQYQMLDSNMGTGTTNCYTDVMSEGTWYSTVASTFNTGTEVNIIGESGAWYEVQGNGITGWIPKNRINKNSVINENLGQGQTNCYTDVMSEGTWYSAVSSTFNTGTEVSIVGESGNWYKVQGNGITGWIPKNRINKNSVINENLGQGQTNCYTDVMSEGTWYSAVSSTFNTGTEVSIVGESGNWYKVQGNGITGWIPKNRINKNSVINENLGQGQTNCYTDVMSEGTWYSAVSSTFNTGTEVSIVGENGNWYKVQGNGITGWIPKNRINKSVLGTGETNCYTDIMSEGTWYSTVLNTLGAGTSVNIIGQNSNWYEIDVNGMTAWIPKDRINQSDWVSKLKVAQTTNQLVTVQVYNFKQAIVQYHVKTDGIWKQAFSTNQGWIGYGGLTNPVGRHEGNGTTPTGVYTFGTAFGAQPNPGTVFTYNRLHPDSYWDADFGTSLFNHYNTWNPGSNWNKAGAEPLWANEAVAYQYAISINYNTVDPHQGWGNAIFLHCTVGGGTAGCVGIPEQDVVYLLQHLDKQAKIVISTENGIYNY